MGKVRVRIETNGYNDHLDVTVVCQDDLADKLTEVVTEVIAGAMAHQTIPASDEQDG